MSDLSGDELAAVVAALRMVMGAQPQQPASAWKLAARAEAVDVMLSSSKHDLQ